MPISEIKPDIQDPPLIPIQRKKRRGHLIYVAMFVSVSQRTKRGASKRDISNNLDLSAQTNLRIGHFHRWV